MECAPDEEVPGEAVPEAAQEEGEDEGVAVGDGREGAALGEGLEEVVGEPGGEADVPALPEVLQVGREIGGAEVFRNREPSRRATPMAMSV